MADELREVLVTSMSSGGVAGAVVGVAQGDAEVFITHGHANVSTRQAFTADTGWLLGSVTKLLTTTVLMRLVDRGLIDLDEATQRYVPEFSLRDPDAAALITVRMLLNHTNGIDADALMPSAVRGRDASRSYTLRLPEVGVLFEPGAGVHYSNPGFVLATRIIEQMTGQPYERAISAELFGPCRMRHATAVQTQALLRPTACGALPAPDGTLAVPATFTYPESTAGAGSTPIVTAADMLAFGRMHLRDGLAAASSRVLSAEAAQLMRADSFDLGVPQAPATGLGWWRVPIAGTNAFWHGGGSPGGTSSFCILPDHDMVMVAYASGPGAPMLLDQLHNTAIQRVTGNAVTTPLPASGGPPAEDLVGEYRSFQNRIVIERDSDILVVTQYTEPHDEDFHRFWARLFGLEPSVTRYNLVAHQQYAPAAVGADKLGGFYGRLNLLTLLPAARGRPEGLHTALRFAPRVDRHTGSD